MTATVTLTESDVFTALRAYILTLITCEVVQGLDNDVPMPKGGFIAITASVQKRLATNVTTYDGTATQFNEQSIQYAVQIDCYGPVASNWAVILSTMLRSAQACDALAPNVSPLYTDDPVQMPIVDGEQRYEKRWMVMAQVQYNPVVSAAQQFANAVHVGIISVDRTYPP